MGAQFTDLELLTYLPRWVALPTGDEWRQTSTEFAARRRGAILFLDLAGFTQLAERLATRGTRGAEDLAEILNRLFGAIIQVIEAHGGDVIAFAGDGILSFWDDTICRHPLRTSVCCGAALQDLASARVGSDTPSVGMRIAVELGDVFLCRVGGTGDLWHHLVVGDTIRTVGNAYRHAKIGQIILCPVAAAAAADFCRGEVVADSFLNVTKIETGVVPLRSPPSPPLQAGLIRSLLPREILERARFDRGRWLAEFRYLSIVQIRLGIDAFEGDFLGDLQSAVETIQGIALRFEGTTYQALMDDKGVCVIVIFGLPSLAHEDDALRAVEAARAVYTTLTAGGLRTSIGVSTGLVFCGECGAQTRREYSVHGQPMNLSSRLMEGAGAGILCDEPTFSAAKRHALFSAPLSLKLKGWTDFVRAYRPQSSLTRLPTATSRVLIGRDTECAALQQSLYELRAGRGLAILIRAEAGFGKTQLLDHFAGMAHEAGCRVVRGATMAIHRSTLYFLWRAIVLELVGASADASSSDMESILAAALSAQPQLAAWAPLLDDILGLGLTQTPLTGMITGAARAASIEELVLHFLAQSAADEPLVLILDDLHWVDGASLALLQAAAHRLTRLLVVASTRPVTTQTLAFADIWGDLKVEELVLGPLDLDNVSQLVTRLLGTAEVSAPLANVIHTQSGGSPFFCEELALGLRDTSSIAIQDGQWQLRADQSMSDHWPLPSSIAAAIIGRIDKIPVLDQLILKVSSIIGGEFSDTLIEGILPDEIESAKLRDILQRLTELGLLHSERKNNGCTLRFRHSLIEDVTYDLLSFEQRRGLHHKAAGIIENLNAGRLDHVCAQLARHWEAAEQFARALDYTEQAANKALRSYANRDALRYANKAMNLAEQAGTGHTKERAAAWEIVCGDAYHELGDFENASRHFGRAMAVLGRHVPTRLRETVPRLLANLARQALTRLRRAPSRASRTGDQVSQRQAAHVYERLSEEYFFANEAVRLLNGVLASLNLAEKSGSLPEIVSGYNALGLGLGMSGMVRGARFFCGRALQLAGSAGGPPEMARAYLVAGVLESGLGGWVRVESYGASARQLFGDLGDRFRVQNTLCMLIFCRLLRGLPQDAEVGLDELDALISADPDASKQVRTWAVCGRAIIECMQGNVRDTTLERLRRAAMLRLTRADELLCHGILAKALVQSGDFAAAAEVSQRGAAILQDSSSIWAAFGAFGAAGIVESLITLREREASTKRNADRPGTAARAASRFFRLARVSPVCRPDALRLRGDEARLCGDVTGAARYWRRAVHAAERLDMPTVAAAARKRFGSAALDAGADRTERLVRKRQAPESLDATLDRAPIRIGLQDNPADRQHR